MTKQVSVIGQICQIIDKMQPSLDENLKGTGISVNRYIATAKTAIQTHPQKDKLESADRNSLYLAIKKSAGDGLMPDGREAALVVYGNTVQYQPMVQGLVKLARNSNEIESINSEVVYENDEFELYYDFDGTKFKHAPNWSGDRGSPILVWASVKLKSGEVIARAYPKERILQIASRSKMSKNYHPGQGLDWEEFWRKAAIRNILKYAPKTTAIEKALEESDHEFSFDNDEAKYEEKKTEKTKKRTTKAEEVVKSENNNEESIIDIDPINVDEENEEIPI